MSGMPFASRCAIRSDRSNLARSHLPAASAGNGASSRSYVFPRRPHAYPATPRVRDDHAAAAWDRSLVRTSRLGRILVAADNALLRDRLAAGLAREQCDAIVTSSDHVLRELQRHQFSLVILDIGASAAANLTVLSRIRMQSCVPVILTADCDRSEVDYVLGLEMGADDFMSGRMGARCLLARARAILRRQEIGKDAGVTPAQRGYRFDGWELHHRSKTLKNPDGQPVVLTKKEYALLVAFLDAPRRVLTRLHLMRATRAHEDIFDRSIDVMVLRLRRKLAAEPSGDLRIQTIRGSGYSLDVDVELLF